MAGNTPGVEIERKFLVDIPKVREVLHWKTVVEEYDYIRQGYLLNGRFSLRLRTAIQRKRSRGILTVKGPGTRRRFELNFGMPVFLATWLLRLCPAVICKKRYNAGRWEIDHFQNVTDPESGGELWEAEIELERENETFECPEWLGCEVTEDLRYTNAKLSERVAR